MAIWLPGYKRVDLGLDGEPYLNRLKPKLEWHTTEGSSVAGARAAFRPYPPHICYDPKTREREQYIPLNRAAYSSKANDREYVIQVEVVGFAGRSHTWPEETLRRLAEDVVKPIAAAVNVPPVVVSQGFHGEGEGIILASPSSPIRPTAAQLRRFSGHLGHQHMPAPDSHWDPGRLPIAKILAYAQEDDMNVQELRKELNRIAYQDRDNPRIKRSLVGAVLQAEANASSARVELAGLRAAVNKLADAVAGDALTAAELKAAVHEAIEEGLVQVEIITNPQES